MNDRKPDRMGKRERKKKDRDDLIKATAMSMARRGKWPSPAAIAAKTGISEPVIERETALLLPARRKWVELKGRDHPQWRDPGDGPVATNDASTGASEVDATEGDTPDKEKASEALARARKRSARQRRTIEELKDKVEVLEEQVRRLLAGIRPAELELILEAGAPQRRKGKAKKRVGVGA